MRPIHILMATAALVATSGCNRGTGANNSSANAAANAVVPAATANAAAVSASNSATANMAGAVGNATKTAGGQLPPNFPGDGMGERGPECIVYLGLARDAGRTPHGRDATIMQQAQDQWQAALEHSNVPEVEWRQMLGSSVNVLRSNPQSQKDAAADWCVENAPEVDPG